MSHGLILVAELMTVLIVILAIGHAVTNGNKALGQFQILGVSGLAIHLRSPHIVTRTNGVTREFSGIVCQEVIEEIGCLPSTLKQGSLARGALMDDTCRHEMSEVVGLEIQTRGKGVFLVFSNLNASSIFSNAVGINASQTLSDNHWGVDISVGTLGQRHLLDEAIHQLVQLSVLRYCIDSSTSLQPFVHIAIVEGRAVVLALNGTGSHLEIGKAMTAMLTVFVKNFPRGVPRIPHLPNGSTMHHIEHITPEAARPSGSTHGQVLHLSLLTMAHVGETLCGHVCCCGTVTN